MYFDGSVSNNTEDIIEKLNIFFSTTISDKLKAEHASDHTSPDFTLLNDHVNNKVPSNIQFKIPLMKLPELISSIKSLDPTKATGLDGISPKVFKSSAEIVSPILLKLINISIQTGNFPDSLSWPNYNLFIKGEIKMTLQIIVQSQCYQLHQKSSRNMLPNTYLATLTNTTCYISLSPGFGNIILVTLHC